MPPVRYVLPGKYPYREISNQSWHNQLDWRSGGGSLRGQRSDSHLPPEYERHLRASEITLAEAMKNAGYKTFFAGKWHLGSKGSWPADHGFEINKGGWDVGGPRGGFFSPYINPNLESGPKGESLTLRLGQETPISLKLIRRLLAYLSFTRSMLPFKQPRHLENTATRQKEWDLQMKKNAFSTVG